MQTSAGIVKYKLGHGPAGQGQSRVPGKTNTKKTQCIQGQKKPESDYVSLTQFYKTL